MSLSADIVVHHLRILGLLKAGATEGSEPFVLDRPQAGVVEHANDVMRDGGVIVALAPAADFLRAYGIASAPLRSKPPITAKVVLANQHPWGQLRSLHPALSFVATGSDGALTPIVSGDAGQCSWGWVPYEQGGVVLIGTDLAGDLVRYRQGDPEAAKDRSRSELWGFAGERPVYLFEQQLLGEDPRERHADWWCWTLRDALIRHGKLIAQPVLPGDAAGAVVVTGDDDQAHLATYEKQRIALDGLPITYFLHPLTRHNGASLAALARGRRVEFALHPDALESPSQYAELFAQQALWFEQLTGLSARMVRNHGYLNDGYWGHAAAWRAAGVVGSSNLPGLDGRVVNGSLLPARLALDGALTDHWSMLTAIGDGIVFIQGRGGRAAGDVVRRVGKGIRESGVPGVVVLNLHPENIDQTQDMHVAARELVQDGFVAWTFSDAISWFQARDASVALPRIPIQASVRTGAEANGEAMVRGNG